MSGLNMMAARLSPGAISESSSSHLPPRVTSKMPKPVMFPARLVEPWDDAAGDGLGHARKDDRDRPRLALNGNGRQGRACQDDVGSQADQLLCERSLPIGVSAAPPEVHPHVAAIGPTQVGKRLSERSVAKRRNEIVSVARAEKADAPHAPAPRAATPPRSRALR